MLLHLLSEVPLAYVNDCCVTARRDGDAELTSVGDSFLGSYFGSTALDLGPLTHLTRVGDSFLGGCSGLAALDLTPLAHLTSVGDSFLSGCSVNGARLFALYAPDQRGRLISAHVRRVDGVGLGPPHTPHERGRLVPRGLLRVDGIGHHALYAPD